MANGMTRNSISQLILKGKNGQSEMIEEMDILAKGKGPKIPLKNPTSNNHSSESLHQRK